MKHDILQQGDCTVTCSCGAVIAGSSLEDAKRKHADHFGLMAAREALGEVDSDHDDQCESLGHDDYLRDEGDGIRLYGCHRCGAEWWEDDNGA